MEDSKRQNFPAPPGLWVVATPIGNLADLTDRAKAALIQADLICCEDTRRASALVHALGVAQSGDRKRYLRVDAHASDSVLDRCVERLKSGENLAYLSDAGTPGVSDPGARLVRRALDAGIRVSPIPGVSALATLMSVAGSDAVGINFRGFFPREKSEVEAELTLFMGESKQTLWIWFESPKRILNSIIEMAAQFPSVRAVVGKEMTKFHEKFFYGPLDKVRDEVSLEIETEGELGEWCLALESSPQKKSTNVVEAVSFEKVVTVLKDSGISNAHAAKLLSQLFGTPRNQAYALFFRENNGKIRKKNSTGA